MNADGRVAQSLGQETGELVCSGVPPRDLPSEKSGQELKSAPDRAAARALHQGAPRQPQNTAVPLEGNFSHMGRWAPDALTHIHWTVAEFVPHEVGQEETAQMPDV